MTSDKEISDTLQSLQHRIENLYKIIGILE